MVLLWSWPWRSLRGQRSILPGMSVPLAVPRRQLPQPASTPLLLSAPSALRIWAGLVGAGSWGARPKTFSGETAAISSSLLVSVEDKTPSSLPALPSLLDTPNSNSPLHASTAASHLLPTRSATPGLPCINCVLASHRTVVLKSALPCETNTSVSCSLTPSSSSSRLLSCRPRVQPLLAARAHTHSPALHSRNATSSSDASHRPPTATP